MEATTDTKHGIKYTGIKLKINLRAIRVPHENSIVLPAGHEQIGVVLAPGEAENAFGVALHRL